MRSVLMICVVGVALGALYLLSRDLLPQHEVTFAAGQEGGGYWQIGVRYQNILARDGIDVTLVETAGSVENAALLGAREVDVALMQGGVVPGEGTDSLGTLFYEPIWLFGQAGSDVPANPGAWDGVRVAAGNDGSGTRAAFLALVAASGAQSVQAVPLSGAEAVEALIADEIDLAFFVAPISAPYLNALLDNADVELMALEQLDALARRLPEAQIVSLPQGAIRMHPALPAQDVRLLTMVGRLDAVSNLHPTLSDRLVEAAREIHGQSDALTDVRRFPGTDTGAVPLDAYARGLIEDGPSALREYLPYWVAAQIGRFAILLLPLVILLLPILRALPGLYRWRVRSRVYRYYAEIQDIDQKLRQADIAQLAAHEERLIEIEDQIAALKLPLSYRDYAYTARLHIDLLRNKILERSADVA